MGLLKLGVPKSWDDSKKDFRYIRKAGVRQFISTYNRVRDLKGDELLWGDEIEYGVFHLDHEQKKVRLCLRATQIMNDLKEKEAINSQLVEGCNWVPEFGSWMVEATPNRPYTGYTTDLLRVERNMRLRRKRMLTVLEPNIEVAPTISAFFMLGAQGNDGTVPPSQVGGQQADSEYLSDSVINPHPRFGTIANNIRSRRGEKVNIRVPLFRDMETPEFKGFDLPHGDVDGCCGSDAQQLWRYGKGDVSQEKYGRDYVIVGCSKSARDEEFLNAETEIVTMQKWLVDVQCDGCRGLFYRSAPGVIVPDADWPRNGDIVVGHEIPDVPGWIRLQNGYYLPIQSDDGIIQFLHKVSTRTLPSNTELKKIGSSTPLFRSSALEEVNGGGGGSITSVLGGSVLVAEPLVTTAQPVVLKEADVLRSQENVRAAIHMDAMAFGMGCCCLQITFQAKDVEESRFMYDQLAVMAPIMMALTAATPVLKGRIADTDCRWGVISESVDDRTLAERGRPDPDAPYDDLAGKGQRRIYKSRYDCISTFIYQGDVAQETGGSNGAKKSNGMENRVLNMYNDIPVPIDESSYQLLRDAGIDPGLAQHVAHLFVRDPMIVYEGAVEEVDDETMTEHWENIQSSNWQTVRWKPPPPRNSPNDPHIGWRTEFRSMEIQLTDFENAAFTVFIVLLTRVILTFDLNMYIPLSRVDANMQRAHSRNASAKGKFYFRRHLAPLEEGDDGFGVKYASMFSRAVNGEESIMTKSNSRSHLEELDENGVSQRRKNAPIAQGTDEENSFEEMSMAEIMCGKGDYYPGLIPLVLAYLDHINCDPDTMRRITTYLDFIERRACGELVTPATWMRNFVRSHPAYKFDSVVSDEIAYDLVVACKKIGEGSLHVPELLGNVHIEPITAEGAYDVKLDSNRLRNDRILQLLKRYTHRASFSGSNHDASSSN